MCCDYGFRSGFGRLYQGGDGEIPKNLFALVSRAWISAGCLEEQSVYPVGHTHASVGSQGWPVQGWDNYKKEFRQLRRSFRVDEYNTISDLNPPQGFNGKVPTLPSARPPQACQLPQLWVVPCCVHALIGDKSACAHKPSCMAL